MIVCRECGTQNADDDLFCGGCPAFLEHSGEHIPDDEPVVAEPEAEPDRDGIVTRIKHALGGDALPPPTGAPSGSPPATGLEPPGRELDPDEQRAAALVAKPTAQEPASAPGRTGIGGIGGAGTGGGPTAAPPQAMAPQKAKPRPRKVKQPPTRKILPGDLICGTCGEGNPDSRKFCRRCGESLLEAEVKKRPWYSRFLPRRKKKVLKAGERADRGSGREIGKKGRILRGKVLGKYANVRRILALLAVVGIGVGFVLPGPRKAIVDGGGDVLGRVRRTISPTYSNIPIDPTRVSASSETVDGEAANVTDSNTLTFWLAQPVDETPSVVVTFVDTTDLQHVLVHPGKQEDGGKVVRPDPRPRELLFRVTDETGTINEVVATLEDEDGFQTIDLGVDAAVSVETVVVNCFPDPILTVCPITELEFQSKD